MDKRASISSTEKVIFFIPVMIILAVVATIFGYIVVHYFESIIYIPPGTEDEIIINRFFSSPTCFVYEDPYTGRAYPGIIDKEKFTQKQLINCYNNPKKNNVKLKITDNKQNQLEIFSENFRNRHSKSFTRQILLKDGDLTYPTTLSVVIERE